MTKARDLANLIAAGNPLADGAISVSEISDLTASAAELNQLDNTADLPDIRPSLLLDFANSKTLDPRITFTRGSTATYWDGKTTAKAEENLITYSQNTTLSPWAGSGTTSTANTTTAPDGTTTANTIEITTEGPYRNVAQSPVGLASTAYTASVYLKKSNWDYVRVNMQSRTSGNGYIDTISARTINLSDGTTVGTDEGTPTTTDVGNGWYRVTFSGTSAGTAQTIFVDASFADSTGNGAPATNIASGSEFFIWGFQLEQRSSATAYTATTSSPIVKYQPVLQTAASGEARFDHDPFTGESKGLLIEEARTNLLTQSGDLSNFSTSNSSLITAAVVAPDGTLSGNKIQENTTASISHSMVTFPPMSASTTYTLSLFAKKAERDYLALNIYSGSTSYWTWYNLSNGTVGTATNSPPTSMEDVGNGWYRCSITVTTASTGTPNIAVYSCAQNGSLSYDGDGYSGIYVWGAQVEVGSFPTSYIPTSGSTVTRAVDTAEILEATMLNYINTIEGTFQVDAIYDPDNTKAAFAASIGKDNNNYLGVGYSNSPSGYYQPTHGGDINSGVSPLNGKNRIAISWEGTSGTVPVYYAMNGEISSVDNGDGGITFLAATPDDIKLTIGYGTFNAVSRKCAHISKVALYPKALSSATLQAMTEA